MTPRVSILLPVWNAGKTLASCLRSLERQRESGWECVLADDGSIDDSLALARDFAARDPRFRVTARTHEGLVATLNAGAESCRAPLVARKCQPELHAPVRHPSARSRPAGAPGTSSA